MLQRFRDHRFNIYAIWFPLTLP